MARLSVGVALLFAAVNVSLPLHAQSISLLVCNAGKVEIDVFLSQAGKVTSSHVGSADCAAVGESAGAMQPGLVGFVFADSRGQWAGARRFDLLPDLGLNVLSTACLLYTSPSPRDS